MRCVNFALKKFARYNYVKFCIPNEIAPLVASSAASSVRGTILCTVYSTARQMSKGNLPTVNFLRDYPRTLMATYLELKAQAEALALQAEEARLAELDTIITTMREQIAEYDITAEQLFGRRRAVAPSTRAPIAPKYRDPKTGATWSGRGKAPQWIANAKNRDRFLIEQ